MHLAGSNLIVSATDVSGYLPCPHLTTLERARARGERERPYFSDPGKDVLRERGKQHEADLLEGYRARGLEVVTIERPERVEDEDRTAAWQARAESTLAAMRSGADVIYQGCLFDGRWLGLPDFLVKVELASELGPWSYEVVDAKLARSAKVGALLQICSYSEMLDRVQGGSPMLMHLALGGPHERHTKGVESFFVPWYAAYFRSVKRRFEAALADEPKTYPEPCTHCTVCDWAPVCELQWRDDDHLSLVAGITKKQRAALEERGAATLQQLAELPMPLEPALPAVSPRAFVKIREQARVQLEGRRERRAKHELIVGDAGVEPGTGLLALPDPSPGDLFFDIEGDPHAYGDGLEYLFGWADVMGTYHGLWALTPEEERARFELFIDIVMGRLTLWPDLHIYHYAAYEPTALKRLAARYATREEVVDRLLRGGVLVDLYRVVRQGIRASVESYSLKKLEPLYSFQREVELRGASSALANFEAWLQMGRGEGADALLQEIEGYNRDDCVSTLRLRNWLEDRRNDLESTLQDRGLLQGELPRPERRDPEPGEQTQEEDVRVRALMDALTASVPDDRAARSAEQQARWILAHLLSWHRREKKSMWWEYFRLRDMDDDELLHEPKALAGLEYEGVVGRDKKSLIHRYRFPAQDFGLRVGDEPRDPRTEKSAGTIVALDEDARMIDLKRGERNEAPHPGALIPFGEVPDKPLRASLLRLADDVVAHGLEGAENRAATDLLLGNPPRAGQKEGGLLQEDGESSLTAARRVVTRLDRTVLPVQGPPGSGKTYIGARMITQLIHDGKRVGITATSHKVIANLLKGVCAAAEERDLGFHGIQKADEGDAYAHARIEHTGTNERVAEALASGEADLAAGTVWLWARPEMAGAVDVIFVDEAGQMSLANMLAASGAAKSIVLLGDPRQLEQPQKGVHPPGTGVSALEHLVGNVPLDPDRGLFLNETYRLHPDVCRFTSELFYWGLLKSRYGLQHQSVDGPEPFQGTGLRFIPVEHTGNTSESEEEVRVVAELVDRLLRAEPMWTDHEEVRRPIRVQDVLVVAPYNAQVTALRAALPAGVPVGTVDKFQGQEAPIVIYSTATSTAQDAPRGMEFLFSPNRLNVATSRARCLVLWVGSPALLGPDCSSVRQMQLANGFCRFGEMATRRSSAGEGQQND
jgi:uncharacterized protein